MSKADNMILFRYSTSLALALFFRIVSVAQVGPLWEVPSKMMDELTIEEMLMAMLLILAGVDYWRAWRRRKLAGSSFMFSTVVLSALLILFIITFAVDVAQWKVENSSLSAVAYASFIPGLAVSAATFFFLKAKLKVNR